jgi:hypothetical protein
MSYAPELEKYLEPVDEFLKAELLKVYADHEFLNAVIHDARFAEMAFNKTGRPKGFTRGSHIVKFLTRARWFKNYSPAPIIKEQHVTNYNSSEGKTIFDVFDEQEKQDKLIKEYEAQQRRALEELT